MIRQPHYRAMIYQLSEEHNNCVLLNFAIQVSFIFKKEFKITLNNFLIFFFFFI